MDINQKEEIVLNISDKENQKFINKRLDFTLTSIFIEKGNQYSRSYFQKLLKNDMIFVNDKKVLASYKLKKNDIIKIKNLNYYKIEKEINSENISLDIIYEDLDILVINKPSGMVTHPAVGNFSGTLVNALMYYLKDLDLYKQEKNKLFLYLRPGIVHRLDKETSGILIVAKNEKSLNNLAKQFENRIVKKTYFAICYKKTDILSGKINIVISRSKIDRKKMAVVSTNNKYAKLAITNFFVIKNFKKNNNLALLKIQPETGRTHQIRVHLSYIGYPILGDFMYGVSLKDFSKKFPYINQRTFLHAREIEFFHPVSNKKMKFIAEFPDDFKKIIDFYN